MNSVTDIYCMEPVKINFILGQVSEEEVERLKEDLPIISKMILSPDDYKMFHYKIGEFIQVETQNGNRLWCTIKDLEILVSEERKILLFTLQKASVNGS